MRGILHTLPYNCPLAPFAHFPDLIATRWLIFTANQFTVVPITDLVVEHLSNIAPNSRFRLSSSRDWPITWPSTIWAYVHYKPTQPCNHFYYYLHCWINRRRRPYTLRTDSSSCFRRTGRSARHSTNSGYESEEWTCTARTARWEWARRSHVRSWQPHRSRYAGTYGDDEDDTPATIAPIETNPRKLPEHLNLLCIEDSTDEKTRLLSYHVAARRAMKEKKKKSSGSASHNRRIHQSTLWGPIPRREEKSFKIPYQLTRKLAPASDGTRCAEDKIKPAT